MPDIKFACPECQQRIAVDDSATGAQIECPRCRSSLVIPALAGAVPEVKVRRRLAVVPGGPGSAPAAPAKELLEAQAAALQAQQEMAKLREELTLAQIERDGWRAEGGELERLRAAENDAALALKTAEERAAALTKERAELRAQLDAAAREAHEQVTALKDQLVMAVGERDGLKASALQAAGELARLRAAQEEQQTKLRELGEQFAVSERERAELQRERNDPAAVKELATLRSQVQQAQAQDEALDHAKRELAAAKAETALLQKNADEAAATERTRVQAQLAANDDALELLRAERDAARQQLTAREEALHKAAGEVEAAKAEAARAQQSAVETTEVELAQAQAQLAVAREETQRLEQRVEALSKDARTQAGALADATKTLAAAETARDAALAQLSTNEKTVKELSGKSEATRLEIESLRNVAATAYAAQDQLKTHAAEAIARTADLQRRIGELENALEQREGDLAGARNAMHIAQSERAETTDRFENVDGEIRNLNQRLTQAGTTEHTLRLQLETAEKNVRVALEKWKASEAERAPLAARLETASRELRGANEQLATLINQRDELQNRAASVETELAQTSERARVSEAEREVLQSELEATRAGLDRTKQHVAALQTRRDEMRDEIAKLKVKLGFAPDAIS